MIGPYPFENAGAIVDHDAGAGYALETQTKPVFDGAPDEETLAHEIAHQWFGDSVTPNIWPNIWLNEGFATYMQWLWTEHTGGADAGRPLRRRVLDPGVQPVLVHGRRARCPARRSCSHRRCTCAAR